MLAGEFITTPLRLAHFLAQTCHESGDLTIRAENMRYSAPRIRDVWPSRPEAARFAGDPVGLANCVYGGRMGNVNPGDGASPYRETGTVLDGSEIAMNWVSRFTTSTKVLECALSLTPTGSGWTADWVPAHNASSGVTVTTSRKIWIDGREVHSAFPGYPTTEIAIGDFVMRQVSTCYNSNDTGKTIPLATWELTHAIKGGILTISNKFEILADLDTSNVYLVQASAAYNAMTSLDLDDGTHYDMTDSAVTVSAGWAKSAVWKGPSAALAVSVKAPGETSNISEAFAPSLPISISDRSGGAGTYDKIYWLGADPGKTLPAGSVLKSAHSILLGPSY